MMEALIPTAFVLQPLVAFVALFVLLALVGSGADKSLSKEYPWQFRLAATFRTPVLMLIVVPLSFVKRLKQRASRRWKRFLRGTGGSAAAARHAANVSAIVDQVRTWNAAGRPKLLRTARPNWQAMSLKLGSNKDECHLIHVSHLDEILAVDGDELTLVAEPGVTMGELTDVLLPLGLALQTHVEMESITLGGVAMGFGIETNSHKYGFFQESVLTYELVDSRGEVVRVTEQSDPKLFYALPWSHGTLGFLVKLEVKLVRVKPYVHMVYEPTASADELTRRLTALASEGYVEGSTDGDAANGGKASGSKAGSVPSVAPRAGPPDFLEATMYDKDRAVIQSGYYVDAPPADGSVRVVPINAFYRPFFFRHVEAKLGAQRAPCGGCADARGATAEVVPLRDFLHRFTRSIFWELEDMIPFSNHVVYRCLWGWLGAPEVSLLKLFQGPVIRRASVYAHVVQESIMPLRRLAEGVAKFDEWFGAYPLLVFPVRLFSRDHLCAGTSGFITPRRDECDRGGGGGEDVASGLWVDLGAYGVPRNVKAGGTWDAKANIRAMEHWTREVGGFQALYTDIFATPAELRQMFDFTLLDEARERLACVDAFPEVYDKVKSEAGISDLSAELEAERAKGK